MNDNIFIFCALYFFFSFIYLRWARPSRKVVFLLALALIINTLTITITFAFGITPASNSPLYNCLTKHILLVPSICLTYLYKIIFLVVDFAFTDQITFALIGLLIIILLFIGLIKSHNKKWKVFFLASLCTIFLIFFFFLFSRTIAYSGGKSGFQVVRPMNFFMEKLIKTGSDISYTIFNNPLIVRRACVSLATLLLIILVIRKNTNLSLYALVTATVLACIAQGFIITSHNSTAIYLYISSGILILSSRLTDLPAYSRKKFSPWKQVILISIILMTALTIGLYKLELYPMRYHPDEALGSVRIMEKAMKLNQYPSSWENCIANIKESPAALFLWQFEPPNARPDPRTPIYSHLAYLCLKVLSVDFVSMRASVVLTGVLSVLFLFLIGRLIFNPPIALMAAFLMSISSWQLVITRLNLPYSVTNLYALICIYLFCKAITTGSWSFYLLLGVILPFSIPFYPSVKIVFFIIATFLLLRILMEKGFLNKHLLGILLIIGGVLIILSSRQIDFINGFLTYGGKGADTVAHQHSYLSLHDNIVLMGKASAIALRNLIRKIYSVNLFQHSHKSYIERSLHFNLILLPFITLGFFRCLFSIKGKGSLFLLLWLLFSFSPNIITGSGEVDRRATLIIAPLMVLGAVGLYYAWVPVMRAIIRTNPRYRIVSAIVTSLFSITLLSTSAANYFYTYSINENKDRRLIQLQSLKNFDAFLGKVLANRKRCFFSKNYKEFAPDIAAKYFLEFRKYSKMGGKFILRDFITAETPMEIIDNATHPPQEEESFAILIHSGAKPATFISVLEKYYSLAPPLNYTYPPQPGFELTGLIVENTDVDLTGEEEP